MITTQINRGIQFSLSGELYLKDPQQSALGQRILKHSIECMHSVGFESFNFKMLAQTMGSAEASIYRYFENKQKLLSYLCCWYWEWVHYLIDMHTMNISDPAQLLKIAIHELIYASEESSLTEYINENLLNQLVVMEGLKSLHFSNVDAQNEKGAFATQKNLAGKIASFIEMVNPKFKYSASLASTLIDMSLNQIYYATHLPRLSSISGSDQLAELKKMTNEFAFAVLNAKQ
jgi:AcrR family transcriptional regulator